MCYDLALILALAFEWGTTFPVGSFLDSSRFVQFVQDMITRQASSKGSNAI